MERDPKRDMDERTFIDMPFEDALEALLTDPDDDEDDEQGAEDA